MSARRRVCLVTDEIYPLTNGGIGRLLHHLIADARRREVPVDFHLMVPSRVAVTQAKLDAVFGRRVTLHPVWLTEDAATGQLPDLGKGYYPPLTAFQDMVWQAQSHWLALELMDLERLGVIFDEIEFPDFRGQAFGAILEKRLGRGLSASRLTVRLHSTFGAIRFFEPYPLSYRDLLVRELERKALLEADLVVAHLPAIAAFNRDFYGFDEEWLRRVRIEFPPVLDAPEAPPRSATPRARPPPLERALVFASRSDPFKRPNLFVQGAAELMRRRPDFTGNALLACHIYHPKEIQALLDAVPPDLRDRFQVLEVAGEVREQLIANAIVVIPSIYESLSLLAYEASAAGATLLLNESCLAFGTETPFVDGRNCLKFDGTVDGLAAALERALEDPALERVSWAAEPPYWEQPAAASSATGGEPPLISVVFTNRDRGLLLSESLESVIASSYENIEIVMVDDASREPLDIALFEQLERGTRQAGSPIKVVRHLTPRGPAAARSSGLALASGDAILFLEAGDVVQPRLLGEAAVALSHCPEIAGVLPTVGYLEDGEDLANGKCSELAVGLGDAPTPGLIHSSSALHPIWRRSALPIGGFNPIMDGDGMWIAYFGALVRGARFLPTPEVGLLARKETRGEGLGLDRRSTVLGQLALQRSQAGLRELWLASLFLALPQHPQTSSELPPVHVKPADQVAPLRYTWIDLANGLFKRTGPLHAGLKRVLLEALSRRGAEELPLAPGSVRPLRHELADRLNGALRGMPRAHRLLRRLGGEARH